METRRCAENQETESFHVGWTQGDDLVWNDGEEIGRTDGLEGGFCFSFLSSLINHRSRRAPACSFLSFFASVSGSTQSNLPQSHDWPFCFYLGAEDKHTKGKSGKGKEGGWLGGVEGSSNLAVENKEMGSGAGGNGPIVVDWV